MRQDYISAAEAAKNWDVDGTYGHKIDGEAVEAAMIADKVFDDLI